MGFLSHAYALSGRVEEGTSLIQQTLSDCESMGLGLFRSLVGVQLGESLLLAGRVEEALGATQQALTLTHRRDEHRHAA